MLAVFFQYTKSAGMGPGEGLLSDFASAFTAPASERERVEQFVRGPSGVGVAAESVGLRLGERTSVRVLISRSVSAGGCCDRRQRGGTHTAYHVLLWRDS